MDRLDGKTAIITGASRGIGAAAAREYVEAGANVVLAARSALEIETLSNELGAKTAAKTCDVTDPASVQNLVDFTVTTFGGLDVLINNAGTIDPISRLEEVEIPAWDKLIDINVKGVFYGIRAALPIMKKQGGGTIISIGSGAATSALEGWSAYCASKAAVHHLHSVLHKEEGEYGIRSLLNSPGTVATDMQKAIRESGINKVSQIPWENHIPAEWVGKTLVWMATAASDAHLGGVVALRGEELKDLVTR
ncbi:MAG: SDR family oxidoreductase [Pseudomonadota bacterium]